VDYLVDKDCKDIQGSKENVVLRELKDQRDSKVQLDDLVHLVLPAWMENLDQWEKKEIVDSQDYQDRQVW